MGSLVVLGGYGNFGRRIVAALAPESPYRILIAGRSAGRAERLAAQIGGRTEPFVVDCHGRSFAEALVRAGARVVIHTAGPFQGQDYSVPRACIEAGCHYVDLADARTFVCGIGELDRAARRNDTLVVSGASSVPALSSAVVDQLAPGFARIDSIEHAITSGARPPGHATMVGVLACAGMPFTQWRDGAWRRVHGWHDLTPRRYPAPVGWRLLANCDVPDLALFPSRYAGVRTAVFRAGVAQHSHMLAIALAAWAVRLKLVGSLAGLVPPLHRIALARARNGSRYSAMQVTVRGRDHESQPIARKWTLVAGSDHGPSIPTFPAIALARKLMREAISLRGAVPCMGLLTVDEILHEGRDLDIRTETECL